MKNKNVIHIGDKIKIVKMIGEPNYDKKIGIAEYIDDAGQIHGTWGGCALVPTVDEYEIISEEK